MTLTEGFSGFFLYKQLDAYYIVASVLLCTPYSLTSYKAHTHHYSSL